MVTAEEEEVYCAKEEAVNQEEYEEEVLWRSLFGLVLLKRRLQRKRLLWKRLLRRLLSRRLAEEEAG